MGSIKTQLLFHFMLGALFFVLLWVFRGELKSLFGYLSALSSGYAVCVIAFLFAFSAFGSFPPLTVVYIMCGMALPITNAFFLGILGSLMFFTFSYFFGRWKGGDSSVVRGLSAGGKKGFLTAFVLRGVRFIPCRMAGIYMGKARLPFFGYLAGSLLGALPSMLLSLLLGAGLKG